MKHLFLAASYLFLATLSACAYAQTIADDKLVQGAALCTGSMAYYEEQYHMPAHLLEAIAAVESGQYSIHSRMKLPWPWTVGYRSHSYYLRTQQEAVEKVKKLQARGIRHVNVGCMQINLFAHARAFANIGQAFVPEKNVAMGAGILAENFRRDGAWRKAVANYKARRSSHGAAYARLVYKQRTRIINAASGQP